MINIKVNDKLKNSFKPMITIFTIILLFYFKFTRDVIFVFFMAFILSYFLKPIHLSISRNGKYKRLCAGVLVLTFFSAIIFVIMFLLPLIVRESNNIVGTLAVMEKYIQQINSKMESMRGNKLVQSVIINISSNSENYIKTQGEKIVNLLIKLGHSSLEYSIVPIVVYYILADSELIFKRLTMMISPNYRKVYKEIFSDIDRILSKYIICQFILCSIIAILTFIVLAIFHIKYPFLLALINGFFNIIPYFGPIIGAIPAILVAALQSHNKVIYVAIFLYLIQQIEGDLISPKITGEFVDLHPMVVLLLIIIGGKVGGFIGMVLAVPAGVILKILYEDINYYLF
ncbi:AI-2E family transporter [Clostridium cellulovorans]|uniref:Permease n=1 Tax=Clostridium cellulovorans (strain ATCC 35296 / DSM 3052 / OCM 3 / 743B) TaxID=573061 RepID=D9SL57_CLOC7|nr:AI-2E family transporter [Clostridium cellulovorans]ADL51573.1 protein of unknown function UPF0118 [Clostridium cellulovorans 743B]